MTTFIFLLMRITARFYVDGGKHKNVPNRFAPFVFCSSQLRLWRKARCCSFSSGAANLSFSLRTGFPPHTSQGGRSFVTTEPAAMIAPWPIRTPARIIAPWPIHTSSQTTVLLSDSLRPFHIVWPGISYSWSCLPTKTTLPAISRGQIERCAQCKCQDAQTWYLS